MLALSTAWRSSGADLPATLRAAHAMGFGAVELGVSGMRFRLRRVQKLLKAVPLKIVSIHNVCTERRAPPANQRGDWLGSPDPEQRAAGVAATRETIEHAEALGAAAVVLHMGSPPIEQRHEKRELLARLVAGGERAPAQLGVTVDDILAERRELAPRHVEAACRSLAELLEGDSKVTLGIECRVGYHEIPSFEELGALLDRFPDPRVGYWHDVGHAVIQQATGSVEHLEWLRRFGGRTVGCHLHDVVRRERLVDHYPPGSGQVDFAAVLELVPPEALRVVEVSSDFLAEEVAKGKRHIEEIGW